MKHALRFVILLGFVGLSFSLVFARKQETGFLDRTVTVVGIVHRFQVYLPATWDKHKKWPVVLFLHGSGESGVDGLLQTDAGLPHAIRMRAADFQFVVVMPQCRGDRVWSDTDMEAQSMAALEQSINEFSGDRNRIYLTGLSIGGYGVWDFAARHPERYAAIAPVAGGIRGTPRSPEIGVSLAMNPQIADPYAETVRRIGKMPVWIFHGDADHIVPVDESRKMAQALRAANANVKYTEYPEVGHNSWDKAYSEPDFVPWLLSHQLPR